MSSGQTVFAGGQNRTAINRRQLTKFEIEIARHGEGKKKDKTKRQKTSSLKEEFLAPPKGGNVVYHRAAHITEPRTFPEFPTL